MNVASDKWHELVELLVETHDVQELRDLVRQGLGLAAVYDLPEQFTRRELADSVVRLFSTRGFAPASGDEANFFERVAVTAGPLRFGEVSELAQAWSSEVRKAVVQPPDSAAMWVHELGVWLAKARPHRVLVLAERLHYFLYGEGSWIRRLGRSSRVSFIGAAVVAVSLAVLGAMDGTALTSGAGMVGAVESTVGAPYGVAVFHSVLLFWVCNNPADFASVQMTRRLLALARRAGTWWKILALAALDVLFAYVVAPMPAAIGGIFYSSDDPMHLALTWPLYFMARPLQWQIVLAISALTAIIPTLLVLASLGMTLLAWPDGGVFRTLSRKIQRFAE